MLGNRKIVHELDVIRAFAIILIVLSHLELYLNVQPNKLSFISMVIAQVGLVLFFFVSGFVLYYNYTSLNSIQGISNFYYKRLIRIYPLYWAAILAFVLVFFQSSQYSYVFHNMMLMLYLITGTQEIFYTNGLLTYFWFISIIILYYFIYPIIIRAKNLIDFIFISSLLFLVIYVIHIGFNIIEINFFKYYWTFIIGIAVCWIKYNKACLLPENKLSYLLLLFVTGMLIVPMAYYGVSYLIIPCILFYLLLNFIFTKTSLNIDKLISSKLYRIISNISTGSYSIYLFHFVILQLFVLLIIHFNLVNYQNWIIILTGIPTVLIIGYYTQKLEMKLKIFSSLKIKLKKELKS